MQFQLKNWDAWAPDLTTKQAWLNWAKDDKRETKDALPTISGMPPMLRRRAQPLGKMALEVLYSGNSNPKSPIVFASRYGEMNLSVQLLEQLAQEKSVSPQAFSMAVHNAVAGLYTIARKEHANISALAAGTKTTFAGLFEAVAQLIDEAQPVRLLICDEPLPSTYQQFEENTPSAFAFMLTLSAGNQFELLYQQQDAAQDASALDLLRFMLTDQKQQHLSSNGWAIQRAAT